MQKQKMTTKRLGRGLEALLVDVPTELTFISATTDTKLQQDLEQQRIQLLQETEQLKLLLETFEQLISQLKIL
jgi:hypothetical protein